MNCPNCGYKYWVSLIEKYGIEHCPICGHKGKFKDFERKAQNGERKERPV